MEIPQVVIDQIQTAYLIKPNQMQRALEILDRGDLRLVPDSGNVIVKSQSHERVEYIIDPRENKCPCPAYGICIHLIAYYLYNANQRYQEILRRESTDIIEQRELTTQAGKSLRGVTEWEEELSSLPQAKSNRSIIVQPEKLDEVSQRLAADLDDGDVTPRRYTPQQIRVALLKWLELSIDDLIEEADWHVQNHNGFNRTRFTLPDVGEGEVIEYEIAD